MSDSWDPLDCNLPYRINPYKSMPSHFINKLLTTKGKDITILKHVSVCSVFCSINIHVFFFWKYCSLNYCSFQISLEIVEWLFYLIFLKKFFLATLRILSFSWNYTYSIWFWQRYKSNSIQGCFFIKFCWSIWVCFQ